MDLSSRFACFSVLGPLHLPRLRPHRRRSYTLPKCVFGTLIMLLVFMQNNCINGIRCSLLLLLFAIFVGYHHRPVLLLVRRNI